MLLANRRHRLLFLAIAGMDVAWVLPFVLTWVAYSARYRGMPPASSYASLLLNPLVLFLLCWAAMILYLFLADLLNRQELDTPARELAILGLLLSTSLIAIRLLYPAAPLASTSITGGTRDSRPNSPQRFARRYSFWQSTPTLDPVVIATDRGGPVLQRRRYVSFPACSSVIRRYSAHYPGRAAGSRRHPRFLCSSSLFGLPLLCWRDDEKVDRATAPERSCPGRALLS